MTNIPSLGATTLASQFSQHHFREMNSFNAATGWDCDFRQLDAGTPGIPMRMLTGSHLGILEICFDRSYHQLGCAPAGLLSFGIPNCGLRDWYARRLEAPAIVNFNHRSGFDAVSQADFSAITFSMSEEWLQQIAQDLGIPLLDQLLAPQPGAMIQHQASVGTLHRRIQQQLGSQQPRLDEDWETAIAVDLLLAALNDQGVEDKSTLPARTSGVTAALAYIEEHRYDAITVTEICRNVGVPWRSLDRGFKERFGVGPKAYLMRQRLAGVYRELSSGLGNIQISSTANAWGFWHMGQFASDYRKMFGELPSDTRRRAAH